MKKDRNMNNHSSNNNSDYQVVGKFGEGNIIKRNNNSKRNSQIHEAWIEKEILCEGNHNGVEAYMDSLDCNEFNIIHGRGNWKTHRRSIDNGGYRLVQVVLEVRKIG